MLSAPLLMLLALLVEAGCGYPAPLFARIGHPVVWIGGAISALDRRLNDETLSERARRWRGVLALALILALALLPAALLTAVLRLLLGPWLALVPLALLASSLIAQRSLHAHVAAVAAGLESGGLAAGRAAVSRIVGRNPAHLDAAGVCRAAIESLAENFSDGVVAPLVWGALLGLPGAAAYKAANTADSMIGHRTPRHAAFGWAAARFDDWINLPASRLAAVFILVAAAVTGGDWRAGLAAVRRDARHHRSPNAGWPEAAMAGALGLRLAGPRVYGETLVADGWMGDGRAEAGPADLRRALRLYRAACVVEAGCLALLAPIALLLSCSR
ncbi:adenosylcobinamide-phosphate synthase CbiB [Acidisoma sp. C75]